MGLIVTEKRGNNLINVPHISTRLLTAEAKIIDKTLWTIIVPYAANDFLKYVLQIKKLASAIKRPAMEIQESKYMYMGVYKEETENDNGSKIVNISLENNLIISNTRIKHKHIHKFIIVFI